MHLFLQSKGHVPSGNLTGQWDMDSWKVRGAVHRIRP